MPFNNKQNQVNRDNGRIAGIQKHCMTQASILVGGVAYTPTQAIQIYQNDLDTTQAVVAAKSALKAAQAKADTAREATDSFDSAFKLCIEGAYAKQPDTLADFEIAVRTPSVRTAAAKAAAADKAKATRKIRHIMGKKQRAMITAATPSDTVTNATTAPAPAGTSVAPAIKS